MECHYCKLTFEQHDLRPYGPNSAMVCFPCATITPEREKVAQEQFAMQLNGSGPVVVLDGTNADRTQLSTIQKLNKYLPSNLLCFKVRASLANNIH